MYKLNIDREKELEKLETELLKWKKIQERAFINLHRIEGAIIVLKNLEDIGDKTEENIMIKEENNE